jgi:hypothetical protein
MNFLLALSVLWQLPAILVVWLFYILPFWALGYIAFRGSMPLKSTGAKWTAWFEVVLGGSWYGSAWRSWWGWAGPLVVITAPDLPHPALQRTLKHEMRHVQQNMVCGTLFYPIYGLVALFIYMFQKEKHSYLDHPLEKDARRAAGQFVEIPNNLRVQLDRWPWW